MLAHLVSVMPERRRLTRWRQARRWAWCLELEPRDLWAGVFIKDDREFYVAFMGLVLHATRARTGTAVNNVAMRDGWCPAAADGMHCEHWWDGVPCHTCGYDGPDEVHQ